MRIFWKDLRDFFFPSLIFCPFCRRVKILPTTAICPQCQRKLLFVDEAVAAYDGLWQEVIHRFKYQGESDLAWPLARLLLSELKGETGYLVPIPLHDQRLRERGYNQCQLLAEAVADLTFLPVLPALIRIKETQSQVNLKRIERYKNVRDAFVVDGDVVDKKILLLDDVLTTGATTAEAKRVLQLAGAKEVKIFVLAKGNFQRKENNL